MESITDFRGEYRWLSNFEICPVEYEGIMYPSSEHAYQAAKSLDVSERRKIRDLPTPGKAKRAGGALKLRRDWESVKLQVMETILLDKFRRNPYLVEKLLATGTAQLIEGNTWGDTFWGVCRGKGSNHLGKILMRIRTLCQNNSL